MARRTCLSTSAKTIIGRRAKNRFAVNGSDKRRSGWGSNYSVQRGDALRHIVEHTHPPLVRLSEVLRQREESDRKLSQMLAAGDVTEAFLYADRKGMIHDATDDETLFGRASEHYADNRARHIETLVVIPFWGEIERFNPHARAALRSKGLLGETEVMREAVKPPAWTEEQREHWSQYQLGDRLLFVRDNRFFPLKNPYSCLAKSRRERSHTVNST